MQVPGDAVFHPVCCVSGINSRAAGSVVATFLWAGLLAYGSPYVPHLPVRLRRDSGSLAAFVPDYSGGPATDLHRLPFLSPRKGYPHNGNRYSGQAPYCQAVIEQADFHKQTQYFQNFCKKNYFSTRCFFFLFCPPQKVYG